jgi:hypothetical protein
LEVAQDGVVDIEDGRELAEDGDVGWVGARGRVVDAFHGSVEISEYGIELPCVRVDSRIWAVQVGEPLGDGREGITYRASPHRSTLLSSFAVAEAKDEEVAQDFFAVESAEGAGLAFFSAEVGPDAKDLAGGLSSFGGRGLGGDVESSAEISCEALSGGRWRSCHGAGCG